MSDDNETDLLGRPIPKLPENVTIGLFQHCKMCGKNGKETILIEGQDDCLNCIVEKDDE